MDLGLTDRGALVVGAGRDVGRSTALQLAAEGARVVLAGRNDAPLAAVAAEIATAGGTASVVTMDSGSTEAVAHGVSEATRTLGAIDVLVNTVGPFPRDPTVTQPMYGHDESWGAMLDAVLLTAVRVCREVIPAMKERGRGAVVNLAANSARYYNPNTAQYGAMKAALTHVTKNWARDAAPHGVRVNAVLPGWIKTAGMSSMVEARAIADHVDPSEVEHLMVAGHDSIFWAGRMGTPEEYGAVITFLASDRASYINGALMPVDGGSPVW
jgi:3-oxoacyl-[acyl-carrier protein] reductase